MTIFKNSQGQLRSIGWVAIFFLVLAALTFPLIIFSQNYGWEITIASQAVVVITATAICQALRKQPMTELFGQFNGEMVKNALLGLVAGWLLMVLPALLLTALGYVHWERGSGEMMALMKVSGTMFAVAVAEETLFRGFIFQELRKGTGLWIAQLLIAAYFLLTHMNNPGMTGSIKALAAINIFLASIMFGLAFIATNSLVMPIAFHFMANCTQGTLLGFGVSGNQQPGLLRPVFQDAPHWLTGGSFGLEASVPGLIAVVITTFLMYRWATAANALHFFPPKKHPVKS